jgi:hypothetical protein
VHPIAKAKNKAAAMAGQRQRGVSEKNVYVQLHGTQANELPAIAQRSAPPLNTPQASAAANHTSGEMDVDRDIADDN